jgi:hypothetical protein
MDASGSARLGKEAVAVIHNPVTEGSTTPIRLPLLRAAVSADVRGYSIMYGVWVNKKGTPVPLS